MKKILFLGLAIGALFCAAPNTAKAQVYPMAQSGDTVTNAETETLTLTINNSYHQVTFQYVCVKLSGTVAGTATLQGSLDNTYWIPLDTVTNTNVASQTFKMAETAGNQFKYYRVVCTGTGTMAARVYVYVKPMNY